MTVLVPKKTQKTLEDLPPAKYLDPRWKYNSGTDLKKTFARVRREQRAAELAAEASQNNVLILKGKTYDKIS